MSISPHSATSLDELNGRPPVQPNSRGHKAASGLASVVAFLAVIAALISGAFLAITPEVDTAASGDTSACSAIHDGWRFTGGLLVLAAGALTLGVVGLRVRDGTDARGWSGGIVGVAVCLLGLALAVVRNDAFACLRS